MAVANLCHIIATLLIIRRRQRQNHKGAKKYCSTWVGPSFSEKLHIL